MDPHSESRLADLEPLFATDMRRLIDHAAAAGIDLRITQGLRTWSQQQDLWAKGRDPAGNVIDKSLVVTNAPPGHSWHQFALAADVAPVDLHGQADWDITHPVWGQIITLGESLGMRSGSTFRSFPDAPHFQPFHIPLSPTDDIRRVFSSGGMAAVWEAVRL